MKKYIWVLVIFWVTMQLPVLGQSEWQIKVFTGLSDAVFVGSFLDGGSSLNVDALREYGLRVSWQQESRWGIESGITYTLAMLTYRPLPTPGTMPQLGGLTLSVRDEPFRYLSIPILATYDVTSFFSFQAGPILGMQLSESSAWMKQSGLGYLVGLNLYHTMNKWLIYLQPNFKQHAVLGASQQNVRLTEVGLQLGFGYRLTTKN
ncbi:MAG: hypothetical protein ACXIUD_04800 [Mongoliitalea sp.]